MSVMKGAARSVDSDPSPVDSCFGGMALYRGHLFDDCKYESNDGDCEHVHLHQCMKKHNPKVRFFPATLPRARPATARAQLLSPRLLAYVRACVRACLRACVFVVAVDGLRVRVRMCQASFNMLPSMKLVYDLDQAELAGYGVNMGNRAHKA